MPGPGSETTSGVSRRIGGRFGELPAIVGLLVLPLAALIVWIGFPIHFPDSGRYLGAALEGDTGDYSPIVLPVLLAPLVRWAGPWAFVAMNFGLLIGVSVSFARAYFGSAHPLAVTLAILASGIGVMAMAVMMDMQTVTGVLALLVLAARRSIFCWIALLVGLLSHSSAVLILAATALVLLLLPHQRGFLARVATAFLAWLLLTLAVNLAVTGELRLFPRYSILFATARVMWDVPQSIDSFARAHPDSAIARHREPLLRAVAAGRRHGPFMWGRDSAFAAAGRDAIAAEARAFILHSLSRYPGDNLRQAAANPLLLLTRHIRAHRMQQGLVRDDSIMRSQVSRYYPEREDAMRRGLQFKGGLESTFSGTVMAASFFFALAVCLSLPLIRLAGSRERPLSTWVVVPLGVLAYVLASAVVYGNLNALYIARFHVKMLYPPVLVLFLVAASAVGSRFAARSPSRAEA